MSWPFNSAAYASEAGREHITGENKKSSAVEQVTSPSLPGEHCIFFFLLTLITAFPCCDTQPWVNMHAHCSLARGLRTGVTPAERHHSMRKAYTHLLASTSHPIKQANNG